MSEVVTPQEARGEVTKEAVIAAYRPFIEAGVTNPDDLDLDDEKVKVAHQLFDQWQTQVKAQASEGEGKIRADLTITMLYVDAGFTDREYLEEVLNDQLRQDLADTHPGAEDPERTETRRQIGQALQKIRSILGVQEEHSA